MISNNKFVHTEGMSVRLVSGKYLCSIITPINPCLLISNSNGTVSIFSTAAAPHN